MEIIEKNLHVQFQQTSLSHVDVKKGRTKSQNYFSDLFIKHHEIQYNPKLGLSAESRAPNSKKYYSQMLLPFNQSLGQTS